MICPPGADGDRARPSTPRLHDSVAPLVKMISLGFACSNAASLSRALSIAARASRPAAWTLDGLPKWRVGGGGICSRGGGCNGGGGGVIGDNIVNFSFSPLL